jgi:hypothetical protein
MSKLKKLSKQVEAIMEEFPLTRADDRLLITTVYIRCYGVRPNAGFSEVMKDYTLPPFESIRRARQKLQEQREDLRADKLIEDFRMALQEEYIEFAREGA